MCWQMWNCKVARLNALHVSFFFSWLTRSSFITLDKREWKKFAMFSIEHTQMESFVKRQIIAIECALLLIILRATTFIRSLNYIISTPCAIHLSICVSLTFLSTNYLFECICMFTEWRRRTWWWEFFNKTTTQLLGSVFYYNRAFSRAMCEYVELSAIIIIFKLLKSN